MRRVCTHGQYAAVKREQYEKYLDMLHRLKAERPGWEKHPNAWIADIFPQERDAFAIAMKNLSDDAVACLEGGNISKDEQASEVFGSIVDYIVGHIDGNGVIKFTYSAAEFITLLYMDYFGFPNGGISAEDIDEEVIEQSVMIFDTPVAKGVDKRWYALSEYQNRLKSLSRNNGLVNFGQQRNMALSFCYPSSRQIFKKLLQGETVNIVNWERANLMQVLRCRTCQNIMFRKYSAKTCNLFDYCPTCDSLGGRTKSMQPLPEKPIFYSGKRVDVPCPKCGKQVSLDFGKKILNPANFNCPDCGTPLLHSYPYVSVDELKDKKIITDNSVFCDNGRAEEVAHKFISRDRNLQKNFGLHSLYMAFGFLNWVDINAKKYRSPLLLVRVRLFQDANKHYCIAADGDVSEAVSINRTLEYILAHYSRDLALTLPAYDGSQRVGAYLCKVKGEIEKFNLGWSVEDGVSLGMFDHQKSMLEEEIKGRFEEYLKNSFIDRLCGGNSFLDERCGDLSSGNFCICDADASQQNVIDRALCGQSFVLQGPPGSGKSQTITNLIAEFIARGKTVLFVTQKSTARSIIYNNLKERSVVDCPLVDYCLNFDTISSTTRGITKKAFREHINKVFAKVQGIPYSPAVNNEVNEKEIREVRSQLFAIEQEYLVEVDSARVSLMQLIDVCMQYATQPECDLLGSETVGQLDINYFCDQVEKFCLLVPQGYLNYRTHPLYGYREQDYSAPSLKFMVEAVAAFNEVQKIYSDCAQIGLNSVYFPCLQNITELSQLSQKLALAASLPVFENDWVEIKDMGEWAAKLLVKTKKLQERAGELRTLRDVIHCYGLTNRAQMLDVARYRTLLVKKKFFLLRMGSAYRDGLSAIAQCSERAFSRFGYRQACEVLTLVERYQAYLRLVEKFKQDVKKCYSRPLADMGIDFNWQSLCDRLGAIVNYCTTVDAKLFDSSFYTLLTKEQHVQTVQKLSELSDRAKGVCSLLEGLFAALQPKFDRSMFDFNTTTFEGLEEEFCKVLNGKNLLPQWIRFTTFLDGVSGNGRLMNVLDALIKNDVSDGEVAKGALLRNYWTKYLNEVLSQQRFKALNSFSGAMFERTLSKYSQVDRAQIKRAAELVYSNLQDRKTGALEGQNISIGGGAQLLKQRDSSSIKDMIADNWPVFSCVKPCFMLSPLMVAQYIDPSISFDLVIFDESSQIFVEDALAAIFRGKQVVIAGDLQQLPPVNFFKAGVQREQEEEEDNVSFANVSYSLLSEAQKMLEKNYALRWHYRSYDERLITFSNRNFYNNSLFTFPSAAKDEAGGVFGEYIPYDANGCYESGKGKHINMNEARCIVQMVKSEIITYPENSIGIVAFSAAQAELIEKLWLDYCATSEGMELIKEWSISHNDEQLIICNLDSIQGDERDTIFISTCYGKDRDGKFNLLTLGPLMNDGGRNRLNVAITRSRHRMVVVTSMHHAQLESLLFSSKGQHIDGARTLSAFLKYVESFSYKEATHTPQPMPKGLEEKICELLDGNNIAYVRKVGDSDCKIDIAVCGSKSGEYLAGIILEPTMNSAKSIREYARLRDEMLQKHGWNLYHIWAIDWFRDFSGESRRLLAYINKI